MNSLLSKFILFQKNLYIFYSNLTWIFFLWVLQNRLTVADLSHRELVGGNIDWLVVFPADQDLVALVDCLLEAPLHCLLQHLLLGDNGHLGQPILPDSTGSKMPIFESLSRRGKLVNRLSKKTSQPGGSWVFWTRSKTTFGPCPRLASLMLVWLPQYGSK